MKKNHTNNITLLYINKSIIYAEIKTIKYKKLIKYKNCIKQIYKNKQKNLVLKHYKYKLYIAKNIILNNQYIKFNF